MGLFSFLSGKPAATKAPPPGQAPSSTTEVQAQGNGFTVNSKMQIAYDPALIAHLEKDHQTLLRTFGLVGESLTRNDLAAVAGYLKEFRRGILGHLMTENIKLYVYLEYKLRHMDLESFELMYELRKEMHGIGKAVLGFLDEYKEIDTRPELADNFGKALKKIGAALVDRIQREEETLYPLYSV